MTGCGTGGQGTNPLTFMMLVQLLGGLALFLYGMSVCAEGLKSGSGGWLNRLIETLTKRRERGVVLGIILTLMTQSSSATSVILVSLVHTGILTLAGSLPVLLGAGVGTTLTVQLIAFRIFDYALILVGSGVLVLMVSKRRMGHTVGQVLLGFGLIFYGMQVMSLALAPLKTHPGLAATLLYFRTYPWMALLVSTLFTTVVQSSGATMAILITLGGQAAAGGNFLQVALPMILGANLGTCITAFLGSIGASREARRVALAQFVQKISGVLICMFFIAPFAALVVAVTGGDTARQLANGHTFFNLFLVLLLLPITGITEKLVRRLIPMRAVETPFEPLYLDETLLATPAMGLTQVQREILRQGRLVEEQLSLVPGLFASGGEVLIACVQQQDEKADLLQRAVSAYLNRILAQRLGAQQTQQAERLFYVNADLESLGDLVVKNVLPLARKYHLRKLEFSSQGTKDLWDLHRLVQRQFTLFLEAFAHNNYDGFANIMREHSRIERRIMTYKRSHLQRLTEGRKQSIETSSIHLDMLDYLRAMENEIAGMCRYFGYTDAGHRNQPS